MRKNLKVFCILLIIVFSILICNNVYATENTTKEVSLEIVDKNGKLQTIMPPNSGDINGYIDSSLDYKDCQYAIWLNGDKDCQYEDSFVIENIGTFKKSENVTFTDEYGGKYTNDVVYIADIIDQSILKTGKFSSKTFKVKNLTTDDYENFKIYLLCFKNQFESNANLSVKGVDFIKNGKIVSEIEDLGSHNSTDIFAYYNRVYNFLSIVNCKIEDVQFNNMGNDFCIGINDETIHCNTGIQVKQNDNIPPESTLKAETITNGSIYNKVVDSIGAEYENLQVYDISIEDSNHIKIQPNGKIELSIPIQNNIDTSKLVVYRVEDNGNKIQYNATVKEENGQDYAVFETDHFSVYVLAEKIDKVATTEQPKEEVQEQPQMPNDTNNKHKLDDEPKTGTYVKLTTIISIILIISIFSIIIIKIKE